MHGAPFEILLKYNATCVEINYPGKQYLYYVILTRIVEFVFDRNVSANYLEAIRHRTCGVIKTNPQGLKEIEVE